jgi:hypothetical protein
MNYSAQTGRKGASGKGVARINAAHAITQRRKNAEAVTPHTPELPRLCRASLDPYDCGRPLQKAFIQNEI